MKTKTLLWFLALTLVPTLTKSQTVPIIIPMLGPNTADGAVRYVGARPLHSGEDIGQEINEAYASLPPSGGTIVVVAEHNGNCYDFSTPVVAAVPGKYLLLEGGSWPSQIVIAPSPACLNYLPTTASSAITLDYVIPGQNVSLLLHGIRNLTITNNHCQTVGGCGSNATGITFGGASGGVQGATFSGLRAGGFGTALNVLGSESSAGNISFHDCTLSYNTTGFSDIQGDTEHISFDSCHFQGNATGVSSSASVSISNSTLDSNSSLSVNCSSPAACDLNDDHFENGNADTTHFLAGNGVFSVVGGDMRDDRTSGNTDWWMNFAGASFFVLGTALTSGGRTASDVILNAGAGNALVQNNSADLLPNLYSNPQLNGYTLPIAGPVSRSATNESRFVQPANNPSSVTARTAVIDQTNSTFTGDNTHSGTETFTGALNCKNFESMACVDASNSQGWNGKDIGGWINSAYSALPASGGKILVAASGSCIDYSTPVVLNAPGKGALLEGAGQAGTCLNFTPTSGTAVTLDFGATSNVSPPAMGMGIVGIRIKGNGSGNTAVGLSVAPVNGGEGIEILKFIIDDFGTGLVMGNGTPPNSPGFFYRFSQGSFFNVGQVFKLTLPVENITFDHVIFQPSFTRFLANAVQISPGTNGSEVFFKNCSFDNAQLIVAATAGGQFTQVVIDSSHFEALNNTTLDFIVVTGGMISITNNTLLFDPATGPKPSEFITVDGNTAAAHGYIAGNLYNTGQILAKGINVINGGRAIETGNRWLSSVATNFFSQDNNANNVYAYMPADFDTWQLKLGGLMLLANEGSAVTCPTNFDGLWPDATAQRWKMCNHGGSTDVLVGAETADTLMNKTLSSPVLSQATINGPSAGSGVQGTDSKLLTSGTLAGVGSSLCLDANGGATTSGCNVSFVQVTRLGPSCTTGSNSYWSCTNTLAWPIPFPDANYVVTCSGIGPSDPRGNVTVAARYPNGVTINVVTYGARSVSFAEIDCTGVHNQVSPNAAAVTLPPSSTSPVQTPPSRRPPADPRPIPEE